MWKHMDGTIAHYTGNMPAGKVAVPDCAFLEGDKIGKCKRQYQYYASYLCEHPVIGNNTTPAIRRKSVIQLSEIRSEEIRLNNSSFTTCPDAHVTHTFLACDVESACWALDFSTSVSCSAPLTPLPPSFTCNNGVQHVPYTLVCDHRSDCSDRSDERFCVFTPCNVTSQFECKNKEVGKLLALTSSKSSSSLLRLDLVILFLLDMTLATDMSSNIKKPIPSSTPKT